MNLIVKQKIFMLLCIVTLICSLSACESDDNVSGVLDAKSNVSDLTISETDAQKSFAKILSIAVAKNEALRTFLKSEAEKQYDKDYDVFYPFVKDKTVTDGKTLRDILVSYSSENEIATIEKKLPLLTVMIPDLASFGAFSINKWDTSDEQVAVTYAKDNDNSVFYAEGDSLLSLPKGDLPNFPFMVVKSNERMKVVDKEATRSGGYADMDANKYDFVDSAFDGTKSCETRAKLSNYDEDNTETAPEDKPYLKEADGLDKRCITAYDNHYIDKYLIDREYVYYDLSPNNKENGKLDPNVREKLYKFRIDPLKYGSITDKQIGEDPHLKNEAYYKKGHPSDEQIAKDLWTDGAYEIVFQVYLGNSSMTETKPISVNGSDLFYISKFHVTKQHHTGFRHSKWWYTTTPKDLMGKWVDVSSENLYLTGTWDLSNSPVSMYIKFFEKDNGTIKTTTSSYTTSYTTKADVSGSGKYDKESFNLGFSSQVSEQKTFTISYQYKDEDDDLGSLYLNFKDPIIISDKYASSKGYEINSLSTGAIDVVIVPTSIR